MVSKSRFSRDTVKCIGLRYFHELLFMTPHLSCKFNIKTATPYRTRRMASKIYAVKNVRVSLKIVQFNFAALL